MINKVCKNFDLKMYCYSCIQSCLVKILPQLKPPMMKI